MWRRDALSYFITAISVWLSLTRLKFRFPQELEHRFFVFTAEIWKMLNALSNLSAEFHEPLLDSCDPHERPALLEQAVVSFFSFVDYASGLGRFLLSVMSLWVMQSREYLLGAITLVRPRRYAMFLQARTNGDGRHAIFTGRAY
jgi:hypothetical protein